MPGLEGFAQRPRSNLSRLQAVHAAPGHGNPAPAGEWPLVMTDDGVMAVCPRCGKRLKVKTIGQAWAAAKSHNEDP